MLVSWNWLKQYIRLDMPVNELETRLMMAGLNHESTSEIDGDLVIDLEVTSNRPDCLGHLGIAREVSALWGRPVQLPAAAPRESATPVGSLTSVVVECPQWCPRYTARVIRGVTVKPSPDWLARRLKSLGLSRINNIVDITNYVLMECGQPLHAFDLNRLHEKRIVVRDARPGETLAAIDHRTYPLQPGMCVIADADHPVGLAGVMGGAESEITSTTTDLLIESAEFDPMNIRATSRALKLKSDSSYRFERGVDPIGVEWASRRCCELILELAGGELAAGLLDVGRQPPPRAPIVLRFAQLTRILGIDIPVERVRTILNCLGLQEQSAGPLQVTVIPPAWRRDLTREIDLVEEVARIHGYEHIPEDVPVPMAPSHKSDADRVLEKIRHVLTALGYDEALTLSAVQKPWSESFSPWSERPPLKAIWPIGEGADLLRRSLVPSLLGARQENEAVGNPVIELFEVAKVYLPRANELPEEPWMLTLCSGSDYFHLKGTLETLLESLNPSAELEVQPVELPLLEADRSVVLKCQGQLLGYLGEVTSAGRALFDLQKNVTVAELRLSVLQAAALLVPKYRPQSKYPASTRDLNFIVGEKILWSEVAACVRQQAGPLCEELRYLETYRGKNLPEGCKSLLLRLSFRGQDQTLTSEQIDATVQAVIQACRQQLGAELSA